MVRQTVYLSLSATVKQINSERDYNETELCHHDQAEVRGIGPPPQTDFVKVLSILNILPQKNFC